MSEPTQTVFVIFRCWTGPNAGTDLVSVWADEKEAHDEADRLAANDRGNRWIGGYEVRPKVLNRKRTA